MPTLIPEQSAAFPLFTSMCVWLGNPPLPGVLELLSPEGCGRLFLFQIKVFIMKDAHPAREDDRAREREALGPVPPPESAAVSVEFPASLQKTPSSQQCEPRVTLCSSRSLITGESSFSFQQQPPCSRISLFILQIQSPS